MNIIKRLRRRFILLAALSIFAIITLALGLVNGISYYAMRSNIVDTLTMISENNGTMPHDFKSPDTNSSVLPKDSRPNDTPEFRYQTRYYSILLDNENKIVKVNISNIAAFSRDEAIRFAETALSGTSQVGFLENGMVHYAYMRTDYADGSHLIVVEDCTRDYAAIHTFQRFSIYFGLGCIALFVLVFAILSGRIIRPFVRNLEGQKRFITNASHELKTPIAIISVNTEALEMVNGKNQWTQGILKQVRRLTNLINHLIILSKADEGGKLEINRQKTPLSPLLQGLKQEFQPLAESHDIKLTTHIEDPVEAATDGKYVREVIDILLDNAVKYCDPKGTVDMTLEESPHRKGKASVIISNDYAAGKGQDFSRFFERFYRNDESHNSKKPGFGIGLSIANELAAALGGKLSVRYKDGRISFILSL